MYLTQYTILKNETILLYLIKFQNRELISIMALEYLNLKNMLIRIPEKWKSYNNEYGKQVYYTLNSLDIFVQKHEIVLEESDQEEAQNSEDRLEIKNEDRIIFMLYKISDAMRTKSQVIFEEWKHLVYELTLPFKEGPNT